MEDSLDIAMRKEIPAFDSMLLREAIENDSDITTARVIKRGDVISLLTFKGEISTWDIEGD